MERNIITTENIHQTLTEKSSGKEILETKELEVVQIPHLRVEEGSDKTLLVEEQQNFSKIEANLVYLEKILSTLEGYLAYHKYVQVLRENFDFCKNRVNEYSSAVNIDNVLKEKVKEFKTIGPEEVDFQEEISELLTNNFKNKGNKICLSDSHLTTLLSVESAYHQSKDEKIKTGILVFDNHVDLWPGELDENDKGNVFHKLNKHPCTARTSFIGSSTDNFKDIKKFMNEKNSDIPYDLVEIEDLEDGRGNINREKLIEKCCEIIRSYKELGITNIVFSIDIDVLQLKKMGYTATEYSPMNSLSYLGSLRLPLDSDPNNLKPDEITNIFKEVGNRESVRVDSRSITKDKTYDPDGLRLGDIGVALDTIFESAKKECIEIGINLKNGGKYLGDIVELTGPDYRNRTGTAAASLINRIKRTLDLK